MRLYLLVALTILVLLGFSWATKDKKRFFQYPFLFCASMLGFIIPQIYVLYRNDSVIDGHSYYLYVFYSILCAIAVFAGHFFYQPRLNTSSNNSRVVLNEKKLAILGILLFSVFFFGVLKLSGLTGNLIAFFSADGSYGLDWRGAPVYYSFLASFWAPSLICLIISNFKVPRFYKWFFILAITAYVSGQIIFLTRRGVLFEVVFIVATFYFLFKNKIPSVKTVLLSLVAAFFVIVMVPYVRPYMPINADRSELSSSSANDQLKSYLNGEVELEVGYAALGMSAFEQRGKYNLGKGYYDQIIDYYVPRGILGDDFKNSLFLSSPDIVNVVRDEVNGSPGPTYMHQTGIGDSFYEFGFGGVLVFFLLSVVFKYLFNQAIVYKNELSKFIYILIGISMIISVTSSSTEMPASLLPLLLIVLCVKLFCTEREKVVQGDSK